MSRASCVFIVMCSLAITGGIAVMGFLGLAAWAFSQATTVKLPFVASFHGFVDAAGNHAVSIDGSWFGALAAVLLIAALLAAAAIKRWGVVS